MLTDEFDRHSNHVLVRDRQSGQWVALARLVLPDPVDPDKPLPSEFTAIQAESANTNDYLPDLGSVPRESCAEVTDFFILERFRNDGYDRRLVIDGSLDGIHSSNADDVINGGLLVGLLLLSQSHNIGYWLWRMDRAFVQSIKRRYRLSAHKVGPDVKIHGAKRHQLLFDVEDVLKQMTRISPELIETFF